MNTQTHLLLGLAAFSRRPRGEALPASTPAVELALLGGALLPDASLFVMWGRAKLAGVPDERIWSELYYSDFWQGIGAIGNSVPAFALVALVEWLAGGRLLGTAARARVPASVALAVAASALLHVFTDLPLHHDDGHPHFWPFSGWIYASPVSYWDPNHHGRLWSGVESALALLLIAVLWRRFRRSLARAALVLAGLSHVAVAAYWFDTVGGGA